MTARVWSEKKKDTGSKTLKEKKPLWHLGFAKKRVHGPMRERKQAVVQQGGPV